MKKIIATIITCLMLLAFTMPFIGGDDAQFAGGEDFPLPGGGGVVMMQLR